MTVPAAATGQVALGADTPALLVAGPDAGAITDGHLSPFTKMWLLAAGVGFVAVALALVTGWYWRRTSPALALSRAAASWEPTDSYPYDPADGYEYGEHEYGEHEYGEHEYGEHEYGGYE